MREREREREREGRERTRGRGKQIIDNAQVGEKFKARHCEGINSKVQRGRKFEALTGMYKTV